MSRCLEARLANARQLSHHRFQAVIRTVSEMARICPDLSRNVRKYPDLSGNVLALSRNVRPRKGARLSLSFKFLRRSPRRYPPNHRSAFPINPPAPVRPVPQKTGGPGKSNPPPSKASLQYLPVAREKLLATKLIWPAATRSPGRKIKKEGRHRQRKAKELHTRLRGSAVNRSCQLQTCAK